MSAHALLVLAAEGSSAGPIIFAAVTGIAAMVLLFVGYRMLKLKRLIEDVPTSKVKGVFIGLNEIKGACECDEPLTAYLSEQPCVWYKYEIEEQWRRIETYQQNGQTKTRTKSGWKTVASEERRRPFRLRDDTGAIRVMPENAKMDGDRVVRETCRETDPLYYGKGPATRIADSTGKRRFTETIVPADAQLYVLGSAKVREDIIEPEIAYEKEDALFLISTKEEDALTSKYGWSAVACIVFGLIAAALCPVGFGWQGGESAGDAFVKSVVHMKTWMILAAVAFALTMLGGYFMLIYNGMVRVLNRMKRAWSLIDVQLKRRHDLIPRLAECARAYAEHEAELQECVASLRATGATASDKGAPPREEVSERAAQANQQTHALNSVFAVAEAYPELKANDLFQNLQENLVDTEDRIALARAFFNESVTAYNSRIGTLPDVVFAKLCGYRETNLFDIEQFERSPVRVKLHDEEPVSV